MVNKDPNYKGNPDLIKAFMAGRNIELAVTDITEAFHRRLMSEAWALETIQRCLKLRGSTDMRIAAEKTVERLKEWFPDEWAAAQEEMRKNSAPSPFGVIRKDGEQCDK